jgi:hypothetical protein
MGGGEQGCQAAHAETSWAMAGPSRRLMSWPKQHSSGKTAIGDAQSDWPPRRSRSPRSREPLAL